MMMMMMMMMMVPGDFFSSLLTLCYCVLHVLRHFLQWNCCVQRMCSTVVRCHPLVFCNSVSAGLSGTAASRFLVAAAACVILWRFAAESRKSLGGACSCAAHVHGGMFKSFLF